MNLLFVTRKKEGNKLRTRAAISFSKDTTRDVTVRDNTIVRMESKLDLWTSECRKNNITLHTNIISTKGMRFHEAFMTMMTFIAAMVRTIQSLGHRRVLFM